MSETSGAAAPIWNENLRTLSADERAFLLAIKDSPKTKGELAEMNLLADALQVNARAYCKRAGLAEYELGAPGPVHRWQITAAGRRAEFFGYVKPQMVTRVRRASPGTPAAKKRAAARRRSK
jgi:hypothetical protein